MSSWTIVEIPNGLSWDINSDLGEVESWTVTEAITRQVTSMNVACGGHAGGVESMRRCVKLAARRGLRLGAHPGPYDRENMGRNRVVITAAELELLLLQQVGALEKLARLERVRLHHVKLHGGLYHAVESDPRLAAEYLRVAAHYWPGLKIYAKAGGEVMRAARGTSVTVWGEAFLDRAYEADGSLTPRSNGEALLKGLKQVRARMVDLVERGGVTCRTGEWLALDWQTLCVHADTPRVARWLARLSADFHPATR